jgi:hypothetical protein
MVVNIKQIERYLKTYIKTYGIIDIQPDGVVNIRGDVKAKKEFPGPGLPIQFGTVHGHMDLGFQPHLSSLAGSPHTVYGHYVILGNNHITTLDHAPEHVGIWPGCRFKLVSHTLISLAHLPKGSYKFQVSVTPHLPLLRLTEHMGPVRWSYPTAFGHVHDQLYTLTKIMDSYVGKGKGAAIQAAAQIIRAGKQIQDKSGLPENPFRENAKW